MNTFDVQQNLPKPENTDSTGKKVFNLAPLEEFLINGITARELAGELDELMLNYVQTIFYLHLHRQEDEDFIHEKIPEFVFYLEELRNVLLECTEQ